MLLCSFVYAQMHLTCIRTYIYVCMHTYMHTSLYTYVCTGVCVCNAVYWYVIYVCIILFYRPELVLYHQLLHYLIKMVCVYVCACAHACVCVVCVCVHACVCVCV